MPFKSKKQERYLQINEPEIYRDWVEKYGRFKGAESFGAENDETIYILKQMDEDKEKGYLVGNEHYIREALDESFYYSMDAWYDDEEKHEKLLESYETMSIEKICETLGIPLVFSRKGGFYFTSIQGDANIHVPDYVENRAESFSAAESFNAENYYGRNYRGFKINKEGDERQAFYYLTKGDNRIEIEFTKSVEG